MPVMILHDYAYMNHVPDTSLPTRILKRTPRAKDLAPRTSDGFAPRPAVQRKNGKDNRKAITIKPADLLTFTLRSIKKPKVYADPILNIEFDYHDDIVISDAEIWQDEVVAELENNDKRKAAAEAAAHEATRKFVEHKKRKAAPKAAHKTKKLVKKVKIMKAHEVVNYTGLNEFIAERFTRKYRGADTSAAMRTVAKQKHHAEILYTDAKFRREAKLVKSDCKKVRYELFRILRTLRQERQK